MKCNTLKEGVSKLWDVPITDPACKYRRYRDLTTPLDLAADGNYHN
jgi:hypothetical protein